MPTLDGQKKILWVEPDHVTFFLGIEKEQMKIRDKGYTLKSLHESYGLMMEEVDEFWEEVKKKPKNRDKENLKLELVQIATMALRAYDLINKDG